MATVQAIIDQAKVFGIHSNPWNKSGKLRIYAKVARKDIKAYLELEGTAGDITGAEFKVFCTTDQYSSWVKKIVKEYKDALKPLFYAYIMCRYQEDEYKNGNYGPDILAMIKEAYDYARK